MPLTSAHQRISRWHTTTNQKDIKPSVPSPVVAHIRHQWLHARREKFLCTFFQWFLGSKSLYKDTVWHIISHAQLLSFKSFEPCTLPSSTTNSSTVQLPVAWSTWADHRSVQISAFSFPYSLTTTYICRIMILLSPINFEIILLELVEVKTQAIWSGELILFDVVSASYLCDFCTVTWSVSSI